MLEFGLIQFEVRQDRLADGSPLWRILALPQSVTNAIHHHQDRNHVPDIVLDRGERGRRPAEQLASPVMIEDDRADFFRQMSMPAHERAHDGMIGI